MARKVFIACDHGGLPLKDRFIKNLTQYNWQDLGTNTEASVDYPDFAQDLCLKLKEEPEAVGVLICGTGQGMAITANKFSHIRAAICWTEEVAQLARGHNDANVLCLGARVVDHDLAEKILVTFMEGQFEAGRHERRVNKISASKGN